MDDARLEEFRKELLAREAELRAAEAGTAEDRAPVQLDQQAVGRLSRVDALQAQEMALETSRRRAAELRRIAAALARMEAGDYGYCVECGEEIPVRRLELDPAAPCCVDCASAR